MYSPASVVRVQPVDQTGRPVGEPWTMHGHVSVAPNRINVVPLARGLVKNSSAARRYRRGRVPHGRGQRLRLWTGPRTIAVEFCR